VRFAVDVTVDNDRLVIDWGRCDPQVPAGMNSARSYSLAYSSFTAKALISPDVPMNVGCMRPIVFRAPEGSFMNPRPPAPGGGRALTVHRHFETVAGALAKAMPDRAVGACAQSCNAVAGGFDLQDEPYLLWDMMIGGFPGRAGKDGTEGLCSVLNSRNVPVEVSETWAPVVIERLELVTDTGGPGQFRGSCALRKDFRFLGRENRVTPMSDRHRFPPHGVNGGGDGACGRIVIDPAGRAEKAHSKAVHTVERDTVVRFEVSGAGGYGPPHRRDVDAVVEDVREGYVSLTAARDQYAVALLPDFAVDVEATERLRVAAEATSQ
jgi:N-methylhydantoinase B